MDLSGQVAFLYFYIETYSFYHHLMRVVLMYAGDFTPVAHL